MPVGTWHEALHKVCDVLLPYVFREWLARLRFVRPKGGVCTGRVQWGATVHQYSRVLECSMRIMPGFDKDIYRNNERVLRGSFWWADPQYAKFPFSVGAHPTTCYVVRGFRLCCGVR